MNRKMGFASFFLGCLAFTCSSHLAYAQVRCFRISIRAPLSLKKLTKVIRVPLAGNTRPEASAANDRGAVDRTIFRWSICSCN